MTFDVTPALGRAHILQGLSPAVIEEIASGAMARRVGARERFTTTQPSGFCYVVSSGRVKLERPCRNGALFLGVARARDAFGLESLYAPEAEIAALTLEPAGLVALPTPWLRRFMEEHPPLAAGLLKRAQEEQLRVLWRLQDIVSCNVPERLLRFLLFLSDLHGSLPDPEGGVLIDAGLTHHDLAVSIGTSRETATGLLNELRAKGYLVIGRRTLMLFGHPQLRAELGTAHENGFANGRSWSYSTLPPHQRRP